MRRENAGQSEVGPGKALWATTGAFTLCFAAWTIFSIVGIELKDRLALSETEFGLLAAMPILSGAVGRVLLGTLADRVGGRRVFALAMVLSGLAAILLSFAQSYAQFLLAGFGVGIGGGAFAAAG